MDDSELYTLILEVIAHATAARPSLRLEHPQRDCIARDLARIEQEVHYRLRSTFCQPATPRPTAALSGETP